MITVAAEGQPRVERLFVDWCNGPVVGEIGQSARLRIEHSKRLFVLRLEGSVACIHGDYVTPVRGDRHGYRQAVQTLRMAGDLADQLLA